MAKEFVRKIKNVSNQNEQYKWATIQGDLLGLTTDSWFIRTHQAFKPITFPMNPQPSNDKTKGIDVVPGEDDNKVSVYNGDNSTTIDTNGTQSSVATSFNPWQTRMVSNATSGEFGISKNGSDLFNVNTDDSNSILEMYTQDNLSTPKISVRGTQNLSGLTFKKASSVLGISVDSDNTASFYTGSNYYNETHSTLDSSQDLIAITTDTLNTAVKLANGKGFLNLQVGTNPSASSSDDVRTAVRNWLGIKDSQYYTHWIAISDATSGNYLYLAVDELSGMASIDLSIKAKDNAIAQAVFPITDSYFNGKKFSTDTLEFDCDNGMAHVEFLLNSPDPVPGKVYKVNTGLNLFQYFVNK